MQRYTTDDISSTQYVEMKDTPKKGSCTKIAVAKGYPSAEHHEGSNQSLETNMIRVSYCFEFSRNKPKNDLN